MRPQTLLASCIASLALFTAALAQSQGGAGSPGAPTTPTAPTAPPAAPPPGPRGGGPGGPGGDGPRDPTAFVQRLMESDANKDGKLSREEVPAPIAERIFERVDANGDGFLVMDELLAFSQSGGAVPGGGRGEGRGPRAGREGGMSFGAGMRQAGRAFEALNGSAFDAASRDTDLAQVQLLQAGLLASKGQVASVRMSEAAKAKFGTDQAAYQLAFRRQLLRAVGNALAMETAILDGKGADAKAALAALHKDEESGHSLFQSEEEHEEGDRPSGAAPGR